MLPRPRGTGGGGPPAVRSALLAAACWAAALAGPLEGAQEERELGWSGSADLGFTLTDGNSETSSLSVATSVTRELASQRWSLSGSLLRSTSEGEETANRATVSGEYDFLPSRRFFLFGKVRTGYNRPAGLDLRFQPSVGAGYVVADGERVRLSLDGGVSYIVDRFRNDSTEAATFGRVGQELSVRVASRSDLAQKVAYSPRAEAPGDYLLHGELAFTTFFVEAVGLKVTLVDEFDSSPFVDETGEARAKNDLTFITALTFRF